MDTNKNKIIFSKTIISDFELNILIHIFIIHKNASTRKMYSIFSQRHTNHRNMLKCLMLITFKKGLLIMCEIIALG